MLDVPRSDEIPQSKRKNLILTGSIASLFFMPNHSLAQKKTTIKDTPNINYLQAPQNPYLLYNPKDINTEYPNWDIFLERLMESLKPQHEVKEKIPTKPQVVPLSFTKRNIHKYFPERSACFEEIISTIQQNPQLARKINEILNQTVMKPTMVHKETNRRPSSERDKICATLIFLEGMMNKTSFAFYIDQRDNLPTLSCEPNNRQVSDTLTYETRLAITDKWIMPGEMMQRVLDADNLFKTWILQQKPDEQVAVK